jgi:hypothetical protein
VKWFTALAVGRWQVALVRRSEPPMEREAMTLNSEIMTDPPAARRFRRLAPLAIVLALAVLVMAPGFFS